MAKVSSRRVLFNTEDNLYYVTEYGLDYVAAIQRPGKDTVEEALRDYIEHMVSVAQFVKLHHIDIRPIAEFEPTTSKTNTPATHMLKIYPDRHIYLVTEDFNKQAIIDKLVEDPVGIIF